MPDITYDVGRVSFVMKGAWNLATSYEKLDTVSYNGSLYIAKQDVPGGTAITNTTYWQLAAEKGDKGDTGGVDSVNGQQGDVWFPDSRQLISDGHTTDTDPFLMKGNDSDSDRFELAKKLGNTVAVNQLVNPANYEADKTEGGVTFEKQDDGRIKITVASSPANAVRFRVTNVNVFTLGHKYLFSLQNNYGAGKLNVMIANTTYSSIAVGSDNLYDTIWQAVGDVTQWAFIVNVRAGCATGTYYVRPISSDLDRWFGSTDRIPSDLLSHPENWGRYYTGLLDYEPGTLESADGSILTSIGRNCFDGELEGGSYNPSTGAKITNANAVRSKNLIPCIPNETYYFRSATALPAQVFYVVFFDAQGNFVGANINGYYNATKTIPANAHFMGFWAGSASYPVTDTSRKFTISLYYSGEIGYDEDYDYSVLAEVDTGSEALRSAGAVADEKTPDGTITRRVGVVDLGTLTWEKQGSQFRCSLSSIKLIPNYTVANLACAKYTAVTTSVITSSSPDKVIAARDASVGGLRVYDTAYSSGDAAAFKTAMSGVYLYYELATPTTEQGTAFDPLVVTVKNGVLSWTNTKGIPVGHESHYFENLRKRVEDRLPDPPSADGTYRLTCTISGGVKTYSWEA